MILDDGHTLPHGHFEGINSGGGASETWAGPVTSLLSEKLSHPAQVR